MGRMSDHRPAATSYAAPNPQPIVKPTITGRGEKPVLESTAPERYVNSPLGWAPRQAPNLPALTGGNAAILIKNRNTCETVHTGLAIQGVLLSC